LCHLDVNHEVCGVVWKRLRESALGFVETTLLA
jgi:hypothetical protein